MRSPLALALCSVLLLLVTGNNMDTKLVQLQKEFFDWQMVRDPLFGSHPTFNTTKYDHLLYNFSIKFFDTELAQANIFQKRALRISRSQLSQRIFKYSYDVLLSMLKNFTINYNWRYFGAVNPINYRESAWDASNMVYLTSFDTLKDFKNYIRRLEAWPTMIAQIKERMRRAVFFGNTNHNVSMREVPGKMSEWINQNLNETDLYTMFNEALDKSSIPNKGILRSRALTALQTTRTKLGELKAYIENTYMPQSRATYGVGALRGGQGFYQACLKWYLSVDMTPDQVYNKGVEEVGRISRLMHAIMTKENFKGTISGYFNKLRADPRFSLTSSDQILSRYRNIILKKIFPKLNSYFKYIPPRNLEVTSMWADKEKALYVPPGTFSVNVHSPNDTKTFTMTPLALHETVPGHHLRMSREINLTLPDFRKYVKSYLHWFAVPYAFEACFAYEKGWGLYAEYLGEEMELYGDDSDKMGRYASEMLQACRVVVDTGLHFKGWTRDRAIQYMSELTAIPVTMVEKEVDRCITFPGQACADKIGELKIKELRQKANTEMGAKFNIRDFHSAVLDYGPVPLYLLEKIVDEYIANA